MLLLVRVSLLPCLLLVLVMWLLLLLALFLLLFCVFCFVGFDVFVCFFCFEWIGGEFGGIEMGGASKWEATFCSNILEIH